ncbi:MAG: patatin-like phospholipase family protein, partial [Acidimicrobiales bacterium]
MVKADEEDRPKIAFVLGGGGRWGAVEVGMLRALVEQEIRPDLIVGTSIGAFNGALFASDPTGSGIGRLTDLWGEVAAGDLLGAGVVGRLRTVARLKVAVGDPQAGRDLLE